MRHPHVRRAMNCATTSQFFVNDRRLFRNGIIFILSRMKTTGVLTRQVIRFAEGEIHINAADSTVRPMIASRLFLVYK